VKFSREIQTLLADCTGQPLSCNTLLKRSGEHGFGLMITLLTLPFLIPVPLVGISTLLNLASFLLGIQLGLGFHQPWLPKCITRLHLSPAVTSGLIKNLDWLLHPLERLVQPRLQGLARNGLSRRLIGFCVAWCAALSALPLPIPFTNKVPALATLFLTVGMLEFDGILICFGYASVVLTTVLFAVLGNIIWEMLGSWSHVLP
jgi:hypothetical protein